MAKFRKGSKAYKRNIVLVLQLTGMAYGEVSAIAKVPVADLKVWVKEFKKGEL
jgi:hypothetical protein